MLHEISSLPQKHASSEADSLHNEAYGPPLPSKLSKQTQNSHLDVKSPGSEKKDSEHKAPVSSNSESHKHLNTKGAHAVSADHASFFSGVTNFLNERVNEAEKFLHEEAKLVAGTFDQNRGSKEGQSGKPKATNQSGKPESTNQFGKTEATNQSGKVESTNSSLPKDASEKIARKAQPKKTNYEDLPVAPPPVRQISERVNRIAKTHHGAATFTHREITETIPSRGQDNPLPKSANPAVGGIEDTLAAISGADKQKPYETVTTHMDGTNSVGRYGINQSLLKDFLGAVIAKMPEVSELMQGPPSKSMAEVLAEHTNLSEEFGKELAQQIQKQAEALEKEAQQTNNAELLARGRNLSKFAENFLEPAKAGEPGFTFRFANFVDRLAGGSPRITADEVKTFLPSEIQDYIAQNQILRYSKAIAGDVPISQMTPEQASKVTLAMFLGRPPTAEDLENIHAKNLLSAASGFFTVANVAQLSNADITVTAEQNKLAEDAEQTASRMDTIGRCAAGVETTLQKSNIYVTGNACDTVAALSRNPHLKEIDPSKARRGTIIVLGASAGHPWGHIKVELGDGREASDHVQNDVNVAAYGSVHAFELV